MRVILISTYEMGRQPFGLASSAAWLGRAGAQVTCCDVSRAALDEAAVRSADLIGFYVPMHTATRLAIALLPRVRELNARAHICFYGLYAPGNATYLRELGVQSILGGEFEEDFVRLAEQIGRSAPDCAPGVDGELAGKRGLHVGSPLPRLEFVTPVRSGLPALREYAHVMMPDGTHRVAGYTEASRGCKHLCRHCPIVPVYEGAFRVVQPEVALADIRQQVDAGAQHITFGDPDFFNGPGHAMRIVESLHAEFPGVSYDVTIKIEHLLKHADLLPRLRDSGCIFVTSAVESVDDEVLRRLDKGHTRADFVRCVAVMRGVGLPLQPTFVPFAPWTTLEGYLDLLRVLVDLELVEHVAPIQLAIRLLIPAGSRLLELDEVRDGVKPFDAAALAYPWRHSDARVDELQKEIEALVQTSEKLKRGRARTFERIWKLAHEALEEVSHMNLAVSLPMLTSRATIPYLNEPWYC